MDQLYHATLPVPVCFYQSFAGLHRRAGKGRMATAETKGIELLVWELSPDNLIKLPACPASEGILNFIFLLSPGHTRILRQGIAIEPADMVLASGFAELSFRLDPGFLSRVMVLSISKQWLGSQSRDSSSATGEKISQWLGTGEPFLFSGYASFSLQNSVMNLYHHGWEQPADPFCIWAKSLPVIYDTVSRFFTSGREKNACLMKMVASIVQENLCTALPSVNEIARKTLLSPSTLKRNFKKQSGYTIYKYYLLKKMELARRMLENDQVNIKQIAFSLGYEQPGSFIKIFRKQFGYSPGKAKHSPQVLEGKE